ncbi:mediator of RNA polymerase II transcription subunit 23-like isoform X2 [Acanthaster planci]|uniref:Mediator of RNA polymerase II transcription subunit 23 n=1 Tax=Acanthaster planci TaxID=133434 RepID=A0A8B7YAP5_ACAPL|nr:mediator of RNA polymerase II transcription subunit 23-like isoform X2 [Acanthaster planci]
MSCTIMTTSTLENQVQEILNDALRTTSIEEAFCGFILHSPEDDRNKVLCCIDSFNRFWKSLPSESHEHVLESYVAYLHRQKSYQRIKLLCDMLLMAAEKVGIPARSLCEALLSSPSLDYKSSELWCKTFQMVDRIIGNVDYKGCRDLLKVILEKIELIPISVNVSASKQLDAAVRVLAKILDRNTCLLPSYFAVNELKKLFPDDKPNTHWAVGELVTNFIDTFRPTARMVSITGRPSLLPVVGHFNATHNSWKLDPVTLMFPLKGLLPYDKEQTQRQTNLLRYVLEQPYSRDMVRTILGLNIQQKQRCLVLEEMLVDLVSVAMERTEQTEGTIELGSPTDALWQHLSSQLIFFVLFNFASFPHMVMSLNKKLSNRSLTKGRDHLSWVLLQYISGSIKKNPLSDFFPILKLFDIFFPEKEPLPVPDVSHPQCTHRLAMACIWIHLSRKAQSDKVSLQRPAPPSLKLHLEFLQQSYNCSNLPLTDYRIAMLCNAYSTSTDMFSWPMGVLVDSIYSSGQTTVPMPGPNICVASGPTTPLSMSLLDSLTVHAKMSLIHHIVGKNIIPAIHHKQSSIALSPALIETYSRLLVYMEIESLGIKGFITKVLPTVCEASAWGMLHTLLELFSFRLQHIQPQYIVQLLCNLHSLSKIPLANQNQLYQCIESTALRIITGLGSADVQPQLSRFLNEPNNLLSADSEELNRALVLTLARAMHVTGSETLSGSWCKDILATLFANTPHNWASHTLKCFPTALQEFFEANPAPQEDRSLLKKIVEEEHRKWKAMTNEAEILNRFAVQGTQPGGSTRGPSQGNQHLFLCLIWKMLLENEPNHINPVAVKVIERIGPRALSSHIRTFADFLVFEFSTSAGGQHVNKCVETLNDMVWKLNIVSLDRLILNLALRNHEGSEAQVCFFIIQLLLLKPVEFRNRVNDFIKENSPEHWLQSDWHTKHMNYHRKYPEMYYYEGMLELTGATMSSPCQNLPVYFSNVCLRFIPVFDILIHRFLELPPSSKSLEVLLDHLGGLYKFHDHPVTYLFNTLHYYEKKLRDRPLLKRKLVGAIILAQKSVKPAGWCLTPQYLEYINKPGEEVTWEPDHDYYCKLIGRLVDTVSGKTQPLFQNMDWRFNEFPNLAAHALHVTCVELMALPGQGKQVGNALLEVIFKNPSSVPRDDVMAWINTIALVLTSLPSCYCDVIQDRIVEVLSSDLLLSKSVTPGAGILNIAFAVFDFRGTHSSHTEMICAYVLAMTHAVWHHSNIGQLTPLQQFIRDQVKPIVKTEEQYLFVCHLVGPFLQRFHEERTRLLFEITKNLYDMLLVVDQHCNQIIHMDVICDFLYHIKYMFAGDGIKADTDRVIKSLRPAWQLRLRFISRGVDPSAVPQVAN